MGWLLFPFDAFDSLNSRLLSFHHDLIWWPRGGHKLEARSDALVNMLICHTGQVDVDTLPKVRVPAFLCQIPVK